MKADNLWMEFDDEVAHLIVERRPVGARNGHVLFEPKLHVVALQALSPDLFPICIGSRRGVTKKIHMDWATRLATYFFQFAGHLFEAQQSTRKRAQPSRFPNRHNQLVGNTTNHGGL